MRICTYIDGGLSLIAIIQHEFENQGMKRTAPVIIHPKNPLGNFVLHSHNLSP